VNDCFTLGNTLLYSASTLASGRPEFRWHQHLHSQAQTRL